MRSQSSSPKQPGMERRGTHLYSLPSALTRRGSNSTLGSSSASRLTDSPQARTVPLPSSSSASSLAESSTQEHSTSDLEKWSLLSIDRVRDSSGMVLVALYHLPTTYLYTWPLQTDPKAPQPRQGTVFIASRRGDGGNAKATITSESLKVLTTVLLTWMKFGARRSKFKTKLGERSDDADWLRSTLQMPRIRSAERRAILELQNVRPIQEWGGAGAEGLKEQPSKGKKAAVLGSLDTNTAQPKYHNALQLSPCPDAGNVPSIEITSPNTSDVRSKSQAPWLTSRKPSYVH
jgi:hypothetical protein